MRMRAAKAAQFALMAIDGTGAPGTAQSPASLLRGRVGCRA